MKEAFIQKAFRPDTLAVIDVANRIIREYRRQGFTLTLRQLYYQFVARDLIANKQTEYKRLGSIINDGRMAGLIDWDAIEDRTRNLRKQPAWSSPEEIVRAAAGQYQEDLWQGQDFRPEVWIEKDALVGVVEPICEEYRVPFFACRGYCSQSEQYAAGKRFREYQSRGLKPLVLHLGDHDPSGIDMTRDNTDRLSIFAGFDVDVVRLALNFDQIEEYGPPPNPAKDTDSRSDGYREMFGDSSWELDALEPSVIAALIRDALDQRIKAGPWEQAKAEEAESRDNLTAVAERWVDVEEFIAGAAE